MPERSGIHLRGGSVPERSGMPLGRQRNREKQLGGMPDTYLWTWGSLPHGEYNRPCCLRPSPVLQNATRA
jgi:hypothetical protein